MTWPLYHSNYVCSVKLTCLYNLINIYLLTGHFSTIDCYKTASIIIGSSTLLTYLVVSKCMYVSKISAKIITLLYISSLFPQFSLGASNVHVFRMYICAYQSIVMHLAANLNRHSIDYRQ